VAKCIAAAITTLGTTTSATAAAIAIIAIVAIFAFAILGWVCWRAPDSQMSALLANIFLSWRHKTDPNIVFLCQGLLTFNPIQ
jgi:hypothetical protein